MNQKLSLVLSAKHYEIRGIKFNINLSCQLYLHYQNYSLLSLWERIKIRVFYVQTLILTPSPHMVHCYAMHSKEKEPERLMKK
ncbi:Putative protein [Zobellia galactanivorans]|uniref:Uncharacterized protein n=1 Tax=Zobellia galactanivorans (strain DSM 12802 / CCUG 47099 / CIP 106680 / NCIMB 13871 / Dsij) TaxID=63186 RepID=G0KZX0_ZOBGA|nr:Putative protein [Zobellia galactanivorans]